MTRTYRIGLIVPSSNTTMETEIPAMLARRAAAAPERFTFHSSRMRMKHVTKEELARMDGESTRCAVEVSDARCDAIAYACLIAIMSQGAGAHRTAEERIARAARENGAPAPVVTSAGALVEAIRALGARRIALVAPYLKPLTQLVVDYFADCGVEVVDALSLEVADNVAVGRLDPMRLVEHARALDLARAEALVLSSCVQMPSLPAIPLVQARVDVPVLSAATATVFGLLRALDLEPRVPEAGRLLDGGAAARPAVA